jgi:hypothetical protein
MRYAANMKLLRSMLVAFSTLATALAGEFRGDVGGSWFIIRGTNANPATNLVRQSEPTVFAPTVGGTLAFSDAFGLRLSYQYLRGVGSTAEYAGPTGSTPPNTVWGHFRDDVHIFSAAPEFNWSLLPQLKATLAPQLNFVSRRGSVSYSTNSPLILLVGPRSVSDRGVTLGLGGRLGWSWARVRLRALATSSLISTRASTARPM